VQRDFVQAEMVKLGKPRDKFWLPKAHRARPRRRPTRSSLRQPERQTGARRGAQGRRPEDVEERAERAQRAASVGLDGGPEPDEGR
jgi:hypothetical protein